MHCKTRMAEFEPFAELIKPFSRITLHDVKVVVGQQRAKGDAEGGTAGQETP